MQFSFDCSFAAEIAPIKKAWGYKANQCTNFSNAGTWAADCRVLDGGTWTGAGTGGNPFRCINASHPRPWTSESLIEPLASARSGGSAALQGWQPEGGTVHCTGVFDTAGMTKKLGVESANVSLISINGNAGAWGATRGREIECPDGAWTLSDRCLQHPVADPYRAFDMCPLNGTNPVNAFTGAKLHSETDFRDAGPNPLVLTRYYSTRTQWRHAPWEESGFGTYWRHNYTRFIEHFKNDTFESATVYLGNGNRYYFNPQSIDDETVWRATEADITYTLSEMDIDGQAYWEIRTASGDRERYERVSGKLHHVLNGDGFITSFHYDESGKLNQINNGFGRSLVFRYIDEGVGTGLIESIVLHVDAVAVPSSFTRYEYENTNPSGYQVMLTKVVYPDETLEDGVDNLFKEYLYNEPEHIYYDENWIVDVTDGESTRSANHPSKLTGIVDENGNRFSTYKYQRVLLNGGYRSMLPVWGGHGVPDTNGTFAGEYKITRYHPDSHRPDSRSHQGYASIEDALGTVRQFHFKNYSGVMRPSQIIGGKCEVCGSDAQLTTHDPGGFVISEVDFSGNKIIYEREERGLEVCRIEGVSTLDATKNAPRRIVTRWQNEFRVMLERSIYEPGANTDLDNCNTDDDSGWKIRHKTMRSYEPGSRRLSLQTQHSYDSSGDEDELARTTSYSYYADDEQWGLPFQLKQIDGPRTDVSDITVYRYAKNHSANHNPGDLIETENALGHITKIEEHDEFGRPTKISDPNGTVTQLAYYARGWLKSRSVDGYTTGYEYDGLGQLTKITLANGGIITQQYDEAHRLTDIEDSFGNHIHYVLDPMGNRISEEVRDASGVLRKSAKQVINGLNQTEKQISFVDDVKSFVTGYLYAADGYLNKIIDPRDPGISATDTLPNEPQVFSELTYDALNRTIANKDNTGGRTAFEYNVFDRVKTVTEPTTSDISTPQGLFTRYTYNGFGEQKSLNSPDTGLSKYSHDTAGNVEQLQRAQDTANGVMVRYEYDALNRLRFIDYSNNDLDVTYIYDEAAEQQHGVGRLTSVVDASGETSFFYDGRGNTNKVITTREGAVKTAEYDYNEVNDLIRVKTPSNHIINYFFQVAEQSAGSSWLQKVELENAGEIEVLANNIAYLPFGPMNSWTSGNGVVSLMNHDLSYRVAKLQHGAVLDNTYLLDAANNILNIDNNLTQEPEGEYQYDYLDRLTNATKGFDIYGYQYDAVGNRLSSVKNSSESTYSYGASTHHLLEVSATNPHSFLYDLNGNTTSRGGVQFGYGADNRLKSAIDSVGEHTAYRHNALGQRTMKAGEFNTIYYYDLHGRLMEESDIFGNVAKTYVYMEDKLLALIDADINPFDDDDSDGMLNGFEQHFGFALSDPADAVDDFDGDGFSNLTEHDAATNPSDISDFPGANDSETVLQIPMMNKTMGIIAALVIMAAVFPYVNSASVVVALVLLCSWAISESVSAKVHFVHTDHLGTPIAMTDENQQVTWRATYSPFGEATVDPAASTELNIRFPGQYYDAETGLHYNYFRDYDPEVGRYMQSDPIGFYGGINTYAYVESNPIAYADPSGLCKVEARCNPLGPGYSHCYVVLTHPDGSSTYFRGQPGRKGPGIGGLPGATSDGALGIGGGEYGSITSLYGAYVRGTIDWTADSVPSTTYVDNDEPCTCLANQFRSQFDDIQNANINYNPLTRNSNSAVSNALRNGGFKPGSAPAFAPGWGSDLGVDFSNESCCAP